MEHLTAEQIAAKTEDLYGVENIKAINKLFRDKDESHLYPVNNAFNATERAIRKARHIRKDYGSIEGLEYALMLDQIISDIVNRQI